MIDEGELIMEDIVNIGVRIVLEMEVLLYHSIHPPSCLVLMSDTRFYVLYICRGEEHSYDPLWASKIHWNTKYNSRYVSNVSQHDMELRKLGLCNRLQCKLGY